MPFFTHIFYICRMKNNNISFYSRSSAWFGHITFAVLTIMAFLFFKERTVILDACYQSSTILRSNELGICANRFGVTMTQIFPLMALRLGGVIGNYFIVLFIGFCLGTLADVLALRQSVEAKRNGVCDCLIQCFYGQ